MSLLLIFCLVSSELSSKEQSSFNFMAAVILCSDFGAPPQIKSVTVSIVSPSICHEGTGYKNLSFLNVGEAFYFFTLCHKGGVICISEFIDISPCLLDSSLCFIQPAFHMMYTAYKLNKQGHNIQPWHTPSLIWNQSVVPCSVLTVASWPAYKFLRRQVRWPCTPISWRISPSLLWSMQSKALA